MTDKFSVDDSGDRLKVLVVANATLDETYTVPATPLAGESLIGVLRARDTGGKGANVATILARSGVSVQLLAGIGDDERGRFVQSSLAAEPMQLTLLTFPNCATDVSLIYTDPRGENSIVTTVSATHQLTASMCQEALVALQPPGYLVLQGNLSEATTHQLIEQAHRQGLTVVLNPSPYSGWMNATLPHADIIFLNEGEAFTLTGLEQEAAIHALLNLGPSQIVLTRGHQGALLGTRTAHDKPCATVIDHCAAVPASVVDTTGAGDTYLAVALASAILRNTRIDTIALQEAAEAAAVTVSRTGTRKAFPDIVTLRGILSASEC